MIEYVPRGVYDEALKTYESMRPTMLTARRAVYDVSQSDWEHLLHMARCYLEAQITGVGDEDGHVTRCKRYLKQLDALTPSDSNSERGLDDDN